MLTNEDESIFKRILWIGVAIASSTENSGLGNHHAGNIAKTTVEMYEEFFENRDNNGNTIGD